MPDVLKWEWKDGGEVADAGGGRFFRYLEASDPSDTHRIQFFDCSSGRPCDYWEMPFPYYMHAHGKRLAERLMMWKEGR
jgi:hypothetical protein